MPAQRSSGQAKQKGRGAADSGWAALTWGDLESWAGSRSVSRGRSYQRGGRVKDLAVTGDGDLLATVVGGDYYAVTVKLEGKRKSTSLQSTCSCPVGYDGCKHAVAVVAEYLEALASGRRVQLAADDDPRWDRLESRGAGIDDEDDEAWDEDDDGEIPSVGSRPPARRSSSRRKAAANWDEKIEREIRAKSPEELADLVWSLVQRFPELYQEFRERIALRQGDVSRLVAEARAEIRRVTSETAWRNSWTGEGHTPDYPRIRNRFERMLELGHPDEVVALGRELVEQGIRQVGQSDDEGDTARELSACLPVVFQAVTRSSLSGPERLLFAIDARLEDDYGVVDEAIGIVLDATFPAEDWSAVADTLIARLKAMPAGDRSAADDFSRKYHRDRLTGWIAEALRKAGREAELQALYESEARITWSYQRLVEFLIERKLFDAAERWARDGIAAAGPTYPGIASSLLGRLGELAEKRQQWDVVAAHAAYKFFDHPSRSTFDELIKAARKAKVADSVRAAALRFLETGTRPFHVPVRPQTGRSGRPISPPSGRKSARTRRGSAPPEPSPAPPGRATIDASWPLPVPDYLVPLLESRGGYFVEPHPHLDVLLDMAIAARRPDEVLHWYEKIRSRTRHAAAYADRTAEAVASSHPERALAIYREALEAQLPHANQSAYESAVSYLRKMRPIYEQLNRTGEWTASIASIRESYRNRPRFMELLDNLEGRTIIQSVRPRRK
jgi:uncharacterized Zn finger protein